MNAKDMIEAILTEIKRTGRPVSYKFVWQLRNPGKNWGGNSAQREAMIALGQITDHCNKQNMPAVSAAVVRQDTGRASDKAKQNLFEACATRTDRNGLVASTFFDVQQKAVIALATNK